MRRSICIVLGPLWLSACGAEIAEVDPGGTGTSGADASATTSLSAGSSDSASSTSEGSTASASGDGQTSGAADSGANGSTSAASGASMSAGVGETTNGASSTGAVGTATGSSASSTGEPAPPGCDELYGDAPQYILCEETEDSCTFSAHTGSLRPNSCDSMCQAYGGSCMMAFDNYNAAGMECDVIEGSNDDCTSTRSTELCVCSKP